MVKEKMIVSPGASEKKALSKEESSVLPLIPRFHRALSDFRDFTQMVRVVLDTLKDSLSASLVAFYIDKGPFPDQIYFAYGPAQPASARKQMQLYQKAKDILRPHGDREEGTPHFAPSESDKEIYLPWSDEELSGVLIINREQGAPLSKDEQHTAAILASYAFDLMKVSAAFARVDQRVMQDFLTGLSNRRYLDEVLDKETQRASRFGSSFSLVVIDLDGFKGFNDTFGHLEGDQLLKKFGQILTHTLRRVDIPTRYGGDEFAIILPETSSEQVEVLMKRVRERLSEVGQAYRGAAIGLSYGRSHCPSEGIEPKVLIHMADERLYKAKAKKGL